MTDLPRSKIKSSDMALQIYLVSFLQTTAHLIFDKLTRQCAITQSKITLNVKLLVFVVIPEREG